jgi:hypothetical protein
MKLTLWRLNRCVHWEEQHPGTLSAALAEAGHEVVLGRRVQPPTDAASLASAGTPGVSCVAINQGKDSLPGALMHEGVRGDRPGHDEYFVPIPLKCIGNLSARSGGGDTAAFWARTRSSNGPGAALLERIVDGVDDGGRINSCFDPSESTRYWQLSPTNGRSEHTPVPTWPFADVRMNTLRGCGYYQILREHSAATGRKNVLVGYSQGATVARYLAYLDREVFDGEPCIFGLIAVQGALQGSPLALTDNAEWIARSVTTMVLSLVTGNSDPADSGGALDAPGDEGKQVIRDVAERAQRAGAAVPEGTRVFAALATLLDAIINANDNDSDRRRLIDVLRTTRKWISGLSGEKGLAFRDLDPRRLDQEGSVLHAIASTPSLGAWHGAVVGCDYRLEEFVRGFVERRWSANVLEHLLRPWLSQYLQRAEDAYRSQVMDVAGDGSRPLGPRLASFRHQWIRGAGETVEPRAHDFIVPSAAQLLPEGGATFLGNLRNRDASHLSGRPARDAPDRPRAYMPAPAADDCALTLSEGPRPVEPATSGR